MIHYVLDGYNIIQSGPDEMLSGGPLQKKREFLLDLVKEFLNKLKRPVGFTAVFDGPESMPYMSGSVSSAHYGKIKVIFSEGKTADERIEELTLASSKPGDIIVVTNDKGLRRRLGTTGAKFMDVDTFVSKLFPAKNIAQRRIENAPDASKSDEIDEEFKNLWLKQSKS